MGEHRSYSGSSMNSIVHQATYGHTWNQGQCGSTFRTNFLVRYKRKDQIKSTSLGPLLQATFFQNGSKIDPMRSASVRLRVTMRVAKRLWHGNPWVSLGKWSTHFGGSYEPPIATAYLAPFLKTFRVSSFKRHCCLLLLFNFTQRPLKIPSLRFWSRHGWCWLPWHGVEETCGSLQCLVG